MKRMDFVTDLDGVRLFWDVSGTGNYEQDFSTGRRHGRQLTASLQAKRVTPFMLAEIIDSFPDQLTAIERGFLSEIGYALLAA